MYDVFETISILCVWWNIIIFHWIVFFQVISKGITIPMNEVRKGF